MPRIVHTENGVTREYTLGAVPVTVGRSARHTIPTLDSRASRDHFKIEATAGHYVAEDTGSRNGTLLNGDILDKPRILRTGDRLMIGAAVFQFLDGTMTTPAPERSPAVEFPPANTTRSVSESEAVAPSEPGPAAAPAANRIAASVPAAHSPPAAPSILATLADGSTMATTLSSTAIVIGRAQECTFAIDDEKLSSRHVEVSETDQGILVKDLRSTNGTKFDGAAFETRLFRDGESFSAGSATFRITAKRFPAPMAVSPPSRRARPFLIAAIAALVILGGAAALAPFVIRQFVDLAPPPPADPDNLLGTAGSLERGAEGWTIVAEAQYQVAPDRDQHKDGSYSFRVRGVDTRDRSVFTASSAPVPLTPAKAWRLEGWLRAQANEGRAGFRLEWLKNGAIVGTTTTDLLEGTFDWKRLSVVAVPPPGADQVRAACVIAGVAGGVWFDAVKLSKTTETPGGAGWNTPWGKLMLDDVGVLRLEGAKGPILWNGTILFEEKGLAANPTPQWVGEKDGAPQSVGTGYRAVRKFARLGSLTIMGLHAAEEDSITWQPDFSREGSVLFVADLEDSIAARLTTRCGEIIEPRDGPFNAIACSEVVLGDDLSLLFDVPADVILDHSRLTLRWPRAAEIAIHLRAAPTWVERQVKSILADATAAARASQPGRALVLYDDLARRFGSREEGRAAAAKAAELRIQGADEAKKAAREVENAKKFGGDANKKLAMDLVDALERLWEGTEFAIEGARLRKELIPDSVTRPPDGTKPPDGTETRPPDKEPVENARDLIKWAEEALAKEQWLKAEIFARNVIDRWPGTPEDMKAGELLGRATKGARDAKERDDWIRETLTRARNLVKNRQPDKAAPLFEEALSKYPESPLMKGVKEELEKLRK